MVYNTILFVAALVAFASPKLAPQREIFACRMDSLSAAERAELPKILDELLRRHPVTKELKNGFELKFGPGENLFPIAAKWLWAESRCCEFFDISIARVRNDGGMTVRLEGPPGVKEFIAADLPGLAALVGKRPAHEPRE